MNKIKEMAAYTRIQAGLLTAKIGGDGSVGISLSYGKRGCNREGMNIFFCKWRKN